MPARLNATATLTFAGKRLMASRTVPSYTRYFAPVESVISLPFGYSTFASTFLPPTYTLTSVCDSRSASSPTGFA